MAFCPYGEYWRQAKKVCNVELLSQRKVQAFQFLREDDARNKREGRGIEINREIEERTLFNIRSCVTKESLGAIYTPKTSLN